MLYYDKIAGASQNDVGIIGADGTAQIKDGTLTVTRGTSLFLYRNTGLRSAAYLRINAVEPYFFDFKKQRYGTLVIDGFFCQSVSVYIIPYKSDFFNIKSL